LTLWFPLLIWWTPLCLIRQILTRRFRLYAYGYYNVYRPHTNNDGLPPWLHEEKWKQVIPVS
ncbi:hypothetical protein FCZ47_29040, partial [Escherichia coli]|nr:hypothetical protein [Escherichia coli]